MKNRCAFFLKEQCKLADNDAILLTVSGGADSMVMLDILAGLPYRLGIAHCNFRLRGKASDEDEAFVRDAAKAKGIPFYCKRFDTENYSKENKISVEMAARELRYEWFQEIAEKENFSHIATAHHLDDSQETFFLNLCRGTGIKGLTGINPHSGNIIRPLIDFTREQIELYAMENQIEYHTDATNLEDKFKRNYIRHHIIPAFKSRFPSFERKMQENIRILQAQEAVYERHIQEVRDIVMQKEEEGFRISVKKTMELPYASTYLFEILHPMGFNMEQIESILSEQENRKGKKWLSQHWQLWATEEFWLLRPNNCSNTNETKFCHETDIEYEIVEIGQFKGFSNNPNHAFFDADKIIPPLQVRFWQNGDSFIPFGMTGRKKLSDFFNDLKIDCYQKRQIPILCNSNGDILWIIGFRSDNRYRIDKNTRRVCIAKTKSGCEKKETI